MTRLLVMLGRLCVCTSLAGCALDREGRAATAALLLARDHRARRACAARTRLELGAAPRPRCRGLEPARTDRVSRLRPRARLLRGTALDRASRGVFAAQPGARAVRGARRDARGLGRRADARGRAGRVRGSPRAGAQSTLAGHRDPARRAHRPVPADDHGRTSDRARPGRAQGRVAGAGALRSARASRGRDQRSRARTARRAQPPESPATIGASERTTP